MDFRTEWSSWVMVLLMMVIAAVIDPWSMPETFASVDGFKFILKIILYPLVAVALATIPVLLVCWIIKKTPDLDYSIRTAFGYMLFLLVMFFVG